MLNVSREFRKLIAQNTKTLFKASLTFKDGTTLQLAGDDVMMGGATYTDAVSSNASFDVGAAVINSFSVTLNNYDRRFDEYDFDEAAIVPYTGVELSDGTVEWLNRGRYSVDQPDSYGTTIGLTALDNMRLFERPYSDVPTVYPATLRTIVMDICQTCGVTLDNPDFANHSYVVQERPDDGSVTCIAMLSYAAQASGNWARVNQIGRLRLDWYDAKAFEGEDWLDGMHFDDDTPYSSGSTADGGNFDNYGNGAAADGGAFDKQRYAYVYAYQSLTVNTDDVVITGVRVTAQDKRREDGGDLDGESALYGVEGYVIEIPDNPLVQYGEASSVAAQIGARVVGMRFRPFDVSALGDPSIEAGDPIVIVDERQNSYRSYITALAYKVGSYESMSCNAESPGRNRAASYTALTRAYVQARNAIKRETTTRERAIEELAYELATSSGLYKTEDLQDDGSTIYYLHDKRDLDDSQIVWKVTAYAIGVSTDGGNTYPVGVDASGRAILSQIYTIGLDADYINTGALSVRDASGREVFRADVETGTVTVDTANFKVTPQGVITATSGTIGGFTIGSSALYKGLPSLSGTAEGVYLGTDGVATVNGDRSMKLSGGRLTAVNLPQSKGGYIDASAAVRPSTVASGAKYGVRMHGDELIAIDAPYLVTSTDNGSSWRTAANETRRLLKASSVTLADNLLALSIETDTVRTVNGLEVNYSSALDGGAPPVEYSAACTGENRLATKAYVDSGLSGKAGSGHGHAISDVTGLQAALDGKASSSHTHSGYALTNHTHSGYASSSHTHAYSELSGRPTFTYDQNANALYISF